MTKTLVALYETVTTAAPVVQELIAEGFARRLLLDSRVVDVPRSSNPIVVPLSSSNPLFFNGLKKAVHFSGNVGA
jgi:hypothetical protein